MSVCFGLTLPQQSVQSIRQLDNTAYTGSTVFNFKELLAGNSLQLLSASPSVSTEYYFTKPADHPVAVAVAAVAIAAAGALAADAVWDNYNTLDGDTKTTTTDGGGESTEGGGATSGEGTETESHMSGPKTQKQFTIGDLTVKRVFAGNTMIQRISKTKDEADILLTAKNVKEVKYKAVRTIKTEMKRKSAFPNEGTKVHLDLELAQFNVTTVDIPKTDGSSMMTITISANGKLLYTFKASVDQGKTPSFSDAGAKKYITKGGHGILMIKGFKKRLEFKAEPGRISDEVVITIVSEGIGKRI